jgi:hypothetical protein
MPRNLSPCAFYAVAILEFRFTVEQFKYAETGFATGPKSADLRAIVKHAHGICCDHPVGSAWSSLPWPLDALFGAV